MDILDIVRPVEREWMVKQMSDLIDRQAAIDIVRNRVKRFTTACVLAVTDIEKLPSAQETLSDGTLQITVDTDISTVDRILLSQSGTHYGNLYYADEAQPHWTPSSKKPPDCDGKYLVTSPRYKCVSVKEFSLKYGWEGGTSLAWMPLPKPYGGESK